MTGPLRGVRVLEVAGIGPGPFAAMVLGDLGAEVVRIDRAAAAVRQVSEQPHFDVLQRNRRSVAVDLKHPEGTALVLDLVAGADVLLEGFRPGVAERLGLGPEPCLARRPSLVYGRMTGWGQDGPYAQAAGHDINYIALAGVLAHVGRDGERPVPPLNLVGDFGGGGMLLAVGVIAALVEARTTGEGQVVDAAMVDGAALLMSMFWSMRAEGGFDPARKGTNLLDGGAPHYDVYACADGGHVSLGSLEPKFFAEMRHRLGLDDDPTFDDQDDRSAWPAMRARLAEVFATRTRDEWSARLEGTDVCFAPVLTMEEAVHHPHNVARRTFIEVAGAPQPAPAPRFSRTPLAAPTPPAHPGEHTREVLASWGIDETRIEALHADDVVAGPPRGNQP